MSGINHMACCCVGCAIIKGPDYDAVKALDSRYGWTGIGISAAKLEPTFTFVADAMCGGVVDELLSQNGELECPVTFAVAMKVTYSVWGTFRDYWEPHYGKIDREWTFGYDLTHDNPLNWTNPCLTESDSGSDEEASVPAGSYMFMFRAFIHQGTDDYVPDSHIHFKVSWVPA